MFNTQELIHQLKLASYIESQDIVQTLMKVIKHAHTEEECRESFVIMDAIRTKMDRGDWYLVDEHTFRTILSDLQHLQNRVVGWIWSNYGEDLYI